jgi:hypothetical protein
MIKIMIHRSNLHYKYISYMAEDEWFIHEYKWINNNSKTRFWIRI